MGLSKVEKTRQRAVLDRPNDTALKLIDELTAQAKTLYESLPDQAFTASDDVQYHQERMTHFLMRGDSELARVAGQYAAQCWMVEDAPESWRVGHFPYDVERMKVFYVQALKRLAAIRDDLPIDRLTWLRTSISVDIEHGREMLAWLRSLPNEDDRGGDAEVRRWTTNVYGVLHRDNVSGAHQFAAATHSGPHDSDGAYCVCRGPNRRP